MNKILFLAMLSALLVPPSGRLDARMSSKEKKALVTTFDILLERDSDLLDYVGRLERKVGYMQKQIDQLYEMHADYDSDESKCDKF